MHRLLSILLIFIAAVATASVPTITVTDEPVIFVDTDPYIDIDIKSDEPSVTLHLEFCDDTRKYLSPKYYTIDCPNGHASVHIPLSVGNATCGAFQYTLYANDKYVRHYKYLLNPDDIDSHPDMRDDFDDFWAANLDALERIPVEPLYIAIPGYSTSRRTVYIVNFQSIDDGDGMPVTIQAYIAVPTVKGKYPAMIHFLGYDSGDFDIEPPRADSNPGWVEMVLAPRGQYIQNRPPLTNRYGEWFTYGLTDKESYYYRLAYLDAVRALDLIAAHDKVDPHNVFLEGHSQGGALCYAVASLCPDRVNAIAPSDSFMSDFPVYFATATWPADIAHEACLEFGITDEQMYDTLSYFDIKNHATRISTPTIAFLSVQDTICPIRMKLSAIRQLAAEDVTVIYSPYTYHSSTAMWKNVQYMDFFIGHINSGVEHIVCDSPDFDPEYYTIDGRRIDSSNLSPGLYIRRGVDGAEKILIK